MNLIKLLQMRPYVLVFALCLLAAGCKREPEERPPPVDAVCVDVPDSFVMRANPANPIVRSAREKLISVDPKHSIYIYPEMKKLYPADSDDIDVFLSSICTEYRDNQQMMRAKFDWISSVYLVPEMKSQRFDPNKPLWTQLTGPGYRRLVLLMETLGAYREQHLSVPEIGRRAPAPISVCEMKFIFKYYLANYRGLNTENDVAEYESELMRFLPDAVSKGVCKQEDLETLYVFRGDGLLKPRSPESNVMEATGRAFGGYCQNKKSRGEGDDKKSTLICGEYFTTPFKIRADRALAAARALLFYPEKYEKVLSMVGSPIILIDDLTNGSVMNLLLLAITKTPLSNEIRTLSKRYYSIATGSNRGNLPEVAKNLQDLLMSALDPSKLGEVEYLQNSLWSTTHGNLDDEGFGINFPLGDKATLQRAYQRLAAVFDRHTYFYRTSIYFPPIRRYFLAATPWQSSSYYIHQSHKFTFIGFAMGTMSSTKMHWMYIFKVKRSNYYGINDIINAKPFSLRNTWFNEREFSFHPYGMEELAFNRLGVLDPNEFEALLFLKDVETSPELLNMVRAKDHSDVHRNAEVEFNWSPE